MLFYTFSRCFTFSIVFFKQVDFYIIFDLQDSPSHSASTYYTCSSANVVTKAMIVATLNVAAKDVLPEWVSSSCGVTSSKLVTEDVAPDTSSQSCVPSARRTQALNVPTCGRATGGRATGGRATGGRATGGRATGGRATGGRATGGRATGGRATGGRATGAVGRATGRGRGAGGDGGLTTQVAEVPDGDLSSLVQPVTRVPSQLPLNSGPHDWKILLQKL